MATSDPYCSTCREVGRRGYCAPYRCYCGHETCPAFMSYVPRRPRLALVNAPPIPPRDTSAWADREESTWIDRL